MAKTIDKTHIQIRMLNNRKDCARARTAEADKRTLSTKMKGDRQMEVLHNARYGRRTYYRR